MSLKLFEVPNAKFPVLMFGGHDSKIHIMAADELGVYQSVCKLSGHEDWITSLDVFKEGKNSRRRIMEPVLFKANSLQRR